MGIFARRLRTAGELLQRAFGREAGNILNDVLDEALADVVKAMEDLEKPVATTPIKATESLETATTEKTPADEAGVGEESDVA